MDANRISNDYKVVPAFEDVKFSDLFAVIEKSEVELIPHPQNKKSKIGGNISVNGSGTNYHYFSVKPAKILVDYIQNNMLAIDYDTIYFDVIIFKDGQEATIYAKYNQIIGSRLVAWVNANSIP